MKLCKTIVMATLIITGLTSQSVLANTEREIPFVGLWEGIDPDDGGNQLRSITLNEAGTLSLTGSSTYFSLCNGLRGVINGTGEIQGIVLETNVTLTCSNSPPSLYKVKAKYELDRKNGTLVERTDLRTKNNKPPIIFHLISRSQVYKRIKGATRFSQVGQKRVIMLRPDGGYR